MAQRNRVLLQENSITPYSWLLIKVLEFKACWDQQIYRELNLPWGHIFPVQYTFQAASNNYTYAYFQYHSEKTQLQGLVGEL